MAGASSSLRVELLSFTPDPERTVIRATRTCYQSFDRQNEASDERLLEHLVKNNESPLEFAVFTFLIEGISRVTSHQIVRHRIASYAQKSQRYVSERECEYVTPPSIRDTPGAMEEYARVLGEAQKGYGRLLDMGIRKEDARFLLPQACTTQIVCSYNARSLRNFLRLRLAPRAQWEIREVATRMRDCVRGVAPALVKDLYV